MTQRLPAGLYGITAEKFSRGRSNIDVVREMIRGGVKIVQYREKHSEKSIASMYEECLEIRRITRENGVLFIINDFVDLALLADADGVHVGQDDLPVEAVRRLVGDKIIGLSTHSPQQATKALASGADYIGVGPIFETHTKDDVCNPVGLAYLEYVAGNLSIPYVAIGGIKEYNIHQVCERGAKTICLVTDIVGAEDIAEKVKTLNRIISQQSA
ncbi:MAG: thiamine phosphate synthase [Deltaproteobacteria bacterium]|nr:thiamine phosphate synthase [Deltaproteobacteria bacterium]